MSGIGAIYDASRAPVERYELETLLAAIEHRGKNEALWFGAGVALGQRSGQSSCDCQTGASLAKASTLYPVVLDGRLDNKQDLLPALGLTMEAMDCADSDLIALAFDRWGERSVERLVGDFAFVLWDSMRGRLLAARDQRGFRPLVYGRYGRRLVFGSEPRQLFADPNVPRTRDELFLACHLTGSPPPIGSTPYASVEEVPPAHYVVVEDGRLTLKEYWRYAPRPTLRYKTRSDYVEHFDELSTRVVRETSRSPGKVGVLLSGGLDSSYVALKASQAVPDLQGISLYVPGSAQMDERRFSRAVAQALGVQSLELDASACWSLSSNFIEDSDFDQPFHPMQAPALMLACEAARKDGIQVLLDGAGGDELFTGGWDYAAHLAAQGRLARAFDEVRTWAKSGGVSTAKAFRYAVLSPLIPASLRAGYRRVRGNPVPDPSPPWIDKTSLDACGLTRALEFPEPPLVWNTEKRASLFWSYFQAEVLPAIGWWERHATLPNSVESRSPLWDLRIIEFVLSTPEWVHRSGGRTKAILRDAMDGGLPAEVRDREDKGLFSGLMFEGMAERELDRVRTALQAGLSEIFYVDRSVLEREFELLCERRHIWWTPLWRAITAGLWLRSELVSCGRSDRSLVTASGRRDL